MGIGSLLKKFSGEKQPVEQIVEGALIETPTLVKDPAYQGGLIVFHLDTRPELEFRQERTFLTPDRKKGEHLKVHCQISDGVARVSWIEKV